jgi:hypothetical protein
MPNELVICLLVRILIYKSLRNVTLRFVIYDDW